MMRCLLILIALAGTGWAGEGGIYSPDPDAINLRIISDAGTVAGRIHLDNCAKHGLEHSWKYYRIWKTGLLSCRGITDTYARCKDDYGEKEINYPSGATMELPHGDLDEKIFRRVCKNCKISEDMRVVHKETWEGTE